MFGSLLAAVSLVTTLTGLAAAPSALAAPAAVPGVTANSITVGNVTVLTGPVPGLFAGALNGVKAYFAYINSQGGVNGRKLLIDSGDDGYQCSTNASVTQGMIGKVYAFVGNFSVLDSCGVPILQKNPDVADISYPLTDAAKGLANVYSFQPAPAGYQTGALKWVRQKYPTATKVGAIYTAAASTEWNEQLAAMKSVGFTLGYARPVQPTDTQFTSDIIRMKSSGVQMLWLTDADVEQNAQLLDAAHQQGWKPKVILLSTAYDANFFKLVNPAAAQGALLTQQFAMFQGEDAKSTPEVALFLKYMTQVAPGFNPDLYSMFSWSSAALFVQALKTMGKNPTQAGLISALKNIHNFTDNNMVPAADVGRKKPVGCYMMGKVDNGKWVRTNPPKSGFLCNPTGYYYAK